MNYKIIYRDNSKLDIIDFIDYIERETYSKEKASELSIILVSEITKLSIFPYMYPKTYKDFHTFNVNNRKIFYKIYEDKKKVVIFRILSGHQDYNNYL